PARASSSPCGQCPRRRRGVAPGGPGSQHTRQGRRRRYRADMVRSATTSAIYPPSQLAPADGDEPRATVVAAQASAVVDRAAARAVTNHAAEIVGVFRDGAARDDEEYDGADVARELQLGRVEQTLAHEHVRPALVAVKRQPATHFQR